MSSIKKKVNDKNPHVALYALEVRRPLPSSPPGAPPPPVTMAERSGLRGLPTYLGTGPDRAGLLLLRLTHLGP